MIDYKELLWVMDELNHRVDPVANTKLLIFGSWKQARYYFDEICSNGVYYGCSWNEGKIYMTRDISITFTSIHEILKMRLCGLRYYKVEFHILQSDISLI